VEVGKRFALTMLQEINKTTLNKPPQVEAGPRQYTVTTSFPALFNLNGSATDDGKPNSSLSTMWEKVSGPGTATFGDLNNPVTTVTLSQQGTYHLRLSAFDGAITAMDAAIVTADTVLNLAMSASPCTTSYCTDYLYNLDAINDGVDPASSNDYSSWGAYGNYPQIGTGWVQYNWSSPVKTDKIDVYWFIDGRLPVGLPASYVLKYWDSTSFVPVTGASGYGVAVNAYNTTTFNQVTTTSLRLEFTSTSDSSVGILEWKVFGSMPGAVTQRPIVSSADVIHVSFAGNKLLLALPRTAGVKTVVLRLFDASGRMIKKMLQENSWGGNYTIELDCLEASRLYIAEVKYGSSKVKTVPFCRMR
jgi:hypothetical protein